MEAKYQALPFGEQTDATGTDASSSHFALLDQDLTASAGLSHAMFREYSSVEGRWTSPDAFAGSYDFSSPQSSNRFNYVENQPLSAHDPSGLDMILPTSVGGSGGGGICTGINTFSTSFDAGFDDGTGEFGFAGLMTGGGGIIPTFCSGGTLPSGTGNGPSRLPPTSVGTNPVKLPSTPAPAPIAASDGEKKNPFICGSEGAGKH